MDLIRYFVVFLNSGPLGSLKSLGPSVHDIVGLFTMANLVNINLSNFTIIQKDSRILNKALDSDTTSQ